LQFVFSMHLQSAKPIPAAVSCQCDDGPTYLRCLRRQIAKAREFLIFIFIPLVAVIFYFLSPLVAVIFYFLSPLVAVTWRHGFFSLRAGAKQSDRHLDAGSLRRGAIGPAAAGRTRWLLVVSV
jgi:hypothetical protein